MGNKTNRLPFSNTGEAHAASRRLLLQDQDPWVDSLERNATQERRVIVTRHRHLDSTTNILGTGYRSYRRSLIKHVAIEVVSHSDLLDRKSGYVFELAQTNGRVRAEMSILENGVSDCNYEEVSGRTYLFDQEIWTKAKELIELIVYFHPQYQPFGYNNCQSFAAFLHSEIHDFALDPFILGRTRIHYDEIWIELRDKVFQLRELRRKKEEQRLANRMLLLESYLSVMSPQEQQEMSSPASSL